MIVRLVKDRRLKDTKLELLKQSILNDQNIRASARNFAYRLLINGVQGWVNRRTLSAEFGVSTTRISLLIKEIKSRPYIRIIYGHKQKLGIYFNSIAPLEDRKFFVVKSGLSFTPSRFFKRLFSRVDTSIYPLPSISLISYINSNIEIYNIKNIPINYILNYCSNSLKYKKIKYKDEYERGVMESYLQELKEEKDRREFKLLLLEGVIKLNSKSYLVGVEREVLKNIVVELLRARRLFNNNRKLKYKLVGEFKLYDILGNRTKQRNNKEN